MSVVSLPKKIIAAIILLGIILSSRETASAGDITSRFNVQAQTACVAEMLGTMDAREVFSGKADDVSTEVARAYRRPIPHIYTLPGSWNMAYIAGSTAGDG